MKYANACVRDMGYDEDGGKTTEINKIRRARVDESKKSQKKWQRLSVVRFEVWAKALVGPSAAVKVS